MTRFERAEGEATRGEGGREGEEGREGNLHVGDFRGVQQSLSLWLGVEGGHHQHCVPDRDASVGLGNVLRGHMGDVGREG